MLDALHLLPFPALVGQPRLKRALTMLAVNPRLGGLLIRGPKGTGKSTAARGLAALLPPVRVNVGCSYGCDPAAPSAWCDDCLDRAPTESETRATPFCTLPLGVTEDRLLGTFDLEHALKQGERRFEPGLLARVNQGVLYVDEVNLLDDTLVDLLLDAAASGVNVVAREGISLSHPARFLLVGTMNPEEGELRPQLLDRFGLCAELEEIAHRDDRRRIVERCLAFEADPEAFRAKYAPDAAHLTADIGRARALLPTVTYARQAIEHVAELSVLLGVAGHRADLLMIKAGATLAALDGRTEISADDLATAAAVVYPHRLKRQPFEDAPPDAARLEAQARAFFGAEAALPPDKKKVLKSRP
jgi:Mg-chelatase subunit ChlI